MSKPKTKVYIYTRVSTSMQIDGYSLDAQKSRMKAYCDNDSLLSGISQKLLANIDMFINLDFVERLATGKLILNVPVLSMDEKKQFYNLMGVHTDKLCAKFHDQFIKMIKNPGRCPNRYVQMFLIS